jgi:hypothetical protein
MSEGTAEEIEVTKAVTQRPLNGFKKHTWVVMTGGRSFNDGWWTVGHAEPTSPRSARRRSYLVRAALSAASASTPQTSANASRL